MISIRGITLAYGARKIFDAADATINRRDRIGLVGSNGAGKSTLLKILSGLERIDSGSIDMAKYVTSGYLAQDVMNSSSLGLFAEVEKSFEDVMQLRRHIAEANEVVQTASPDSVEYREALETIGGLELELEDKEESKLASRIETVLHGLGFSQADMQKPCSEFSGGWQMRIALAKLLLRRPSLLMLDEPTNHLDMESVIWLEQYLKNYDGAVMIVSHDRSFLDALTGKTFRISKGHIESYAGNYSYYEKESALRRENLIKAAQNQQREIDKTEKFIERFRAKNTKAAQVQSRIKALEKVDRIEVESEESGIGFRFQKPERSGQVVISLKNITKAYGGNRVLENVSFNIERGERIAIAGANGAGKSTLVRIMAGMLPFDSGETELGHNVSMSYFAQHQADELDPNNTALEEASLAASMEQKPKVRTLLGSFLFTGDDALKKVGVLSGGEKNRLALAKMLLKSFNFLILDEPTNHLDMNSKKVLQRAVMAYEGTLVVVSHDRDFIDPLVNKVIEVGRRGVKFHLGDVSSYVEKLRERGAGLPAASNARRAAVGAPAPSKLTSKERRVLTAKMNAEISPLKKSADALEKEIMAMEDEKSALEDRMSSPEFYKDSASANSLSWYGELKAKLEAAYEKWQAVLDEIEGIRARAQDAD